MIMTVGDSRVGKSTVTKLLVERYQAQGQKIQLYNHDQRNRLKAYENLVPIKNLDFFGGETDTILKDLNNQELEIILVDMPGQYVEKICEYITKSQLLDLLIVYGWRLTFVQPISHRKDCLDYLRQLIDTATNNANYVVVKNQHFDCSFREYCRTMQSKLPFIGGAEVELTALHRDHYQAMEELGKPYSSCYQDTSIYVIYRSYIYRWLKHFFDSVDNSSASKYLGMTR